MAAQPYPQPADETAGPGDHATFTVRLPELGLIADAERRSYGVYAVAALTLILIPVVSSPMAHLSDGSRFLSVVVLCAALAASFWGVSKGLRYLLRLERGAQDSFLSTLASTGLAPLEPVDILQRPETLVLTDSAEVSVWQAEYDDESVLLHRVKPTAAS